MTPQEAEMLNGLTGSKARPARPQAHRFVKFIADEIYRLRISERQLERDVGLGSKIIMWWRFGRLPRIDLLELVLRRLGYGIVIVRLEDIP